MCLMKKDQCHLYFGLTNAEDRTKIMKGDAIMKRKIMAVLLAAAMTGSLAGCGSTQNKNAADASEEKMKVAMLTDSGDITDQSFNQMTKKIIRSWYSECITENMKCPATVQHFRKQRSQQPITAALNNKT